MLSKSARSKNAHAKRNASGIKASDPPSNLCEAEALAQARRRIINALPGIADALVKKAEEGQVPPAKMLFDFAGLTAAQPAEQPSQLAPIMKMLAEQLGLDWPRPAEP